jgi:hypothetical protein
MMKSQLFLLTILMLTASLKTQAREVCDTLMSTKNDRIIVTYDISQKNGNVVIQFRDVKKKLGRTYKDKYKKLDEVAVFFFDRVESFEDMKFSGIDTQAFMTPSGVKYKSSKDGYFLMNDNPSLTMELSTSEAQSLSIPMFLAHYEGKHHYKVFSRCENLVLKLNRSNASSSSSQVQQESQTITSQEEVDGTFTEEDEAGILVNKVSDLLGEQDEYPFSDELKQAIASLRDRSYRISDAKLSTRISDVLAACKLKEEELKAKANATAEAKAKEAEEKAQKAAEQAQARQDSIAAVAQQKAEEDKKRNIWLMIGGVVLAVLAFVGSQVSQHFRNAKNQKNMMDMQNAVAKQAEQEAKRRARTIAQAQARQARSEMQKGARNFVNKGIGKGKNKKDVSI